MQQWSILHWVDEIYRLSAEHSELIVTPTFHQRKIVLNFECFHEEIFDD
ncbi:hypothetical protein HDE71_002451 [Janthinobacterium sp. S3M3]|nr:hypothetical protein [Janthinobacterium sp. S3T4]MBB5613428.1 hypothetical protein [Janthinobacterium sp. S3M3]